MAQPMFLNLKPIFGPSWENGPAFLKSFDPPGTEAIIVNQQHCWSRR
jgi:hypothetical protein